MVDVLRDRTVMWTGDDPAALPHKAIGEAISEAGYCVVRCPDTHPDRLVGLGRLFGPLQMHERADNRGIVEVTNKSDSMRDPKQFLGLSDGNFPPHTDGAYIDILYTSDDNTINHLSPPAILILQVVVPADSGGETILVDTQRIFNDLQQNRNLSRALAQNAYIFARTSLRAGPFPIYRMGETGHVYCRFREDVEAIESHHGYVSDLFSNYFANPFYETRFTPIEGNLLVVDNLRMLHARTAFRMNSGDKFRILRRVWVADHWRHLNMNLANGAPLRAAGAVIQRQDLAPLLPKSDDATVQHYRWIHEKHPGEINGPCPGRIEPQLGIKPISN